AFLAWLAGIENPEMEARLRGVWDGVRYGIPSNDPAAASFNARRYWRGPTWPVVNALIAMGLSGAGRDAEEARLRAETVALIEASGFFEYFDPLDGTPCGGDHFTWTAAIWLAWASPRAGEG
ncbi:MAG: MGH1-like glycoside hydrolase domain-containing protein, partial [Roseicyclus sp.]